MTMMMPPPPPAAAAPQFAATRNMVAPPQATTPATAAPYATTPDAQRLVEEYRLAVEFRRKHTSRTRQLEERYVGNWYRSDQVIDPTPENSLASYITFMLPELAFSTPTVRIRAKRAVSHAAIAEFMQMGLRSLVAEIGLEDEIEDATRDALTGWGVMHVGLEARHHNSRECDGAYEDDQAPRSLRPFAEVIPRERFLMEGTAARPQHAKWMAHEYFRRREQIEGNPRFDPDAVDHLYRAVEGDATGRQESALRPAQAPAERDMVKLVDFWLRDTQQLVTMAMCGDDVAPVVLRTEKWWGPPEGPYVVFGIYRVSGDPYPISPLQMVMEQFEELQQHLATQSDEAANYKTITLVEAGATDLLNTIANGTNGAVYSVKGLANNVQEVSLGKVHPERIQHAMQLRDRFDRTIGFGDAQRGQASGKTATENQIVQANVDLRTQFMRKKIRGGVAEVLKRLGWYLFYDPSVSQDVSMDDPVTGQPVEGLFLGGQIERPTLDYRGQLQQPQDDVDWPGFNLEIDRTSMEFTDDQVLQQRWLQVIQATMQVGQLMQSMPWVNWRYAYDQLGQSFNVTELSKLMFNPQAMAAFAQDPRLFAGGQPVPLPAGARPDFANAGLALPPMAQQGLAPGRGMGGPGMGAVGGNFNANLGPGMMNPRQGPGKAAPNGSAGTSAPPVRRPT